VHKYVNPTIAIPELKPTHFLRLPALLRDLLNPDVKFAAVLGAGISVSAGYSAFRSDNSVFATMQRAYAQYQDKPEGDDSFLGWAFSVTALRNDPRVMYRVLHQFEKSMHECEVRPTPTHLFLQFLAE
jgi:NAD-dependent SIR2 family protein deacetylase